MPSVFEKISQEEVSGSQISEILIEEGLKLVLSDIGGKKVVCEDASGERFFVKYSSNAEETMYVNVLPAIEKQKLHVIIGKLEYVKKNLI